MRLPLSTLASLSLDYERKAKVAQREVNRLFRLAKAHREAAKAKRLAEAGR
jgi:hypothetical protein